MNLIDKDKIVSDLQKVLGITDEQIEKGGINADIIDSANPLIGGFLQYILNLPTIDVDVKHEEWIPCSERLPSKKEIVLITNSKGNVRCGQFRGTYEKYWTWKGNTLETVVAWMPLPEPWKGEQE